MTATDMVAISGSRPELMSATYRRLRRMGFDDPEAANLTALTDGFRITSQPWTIRELTHLLFLRELARARGAWSGYDDRASADVGDGWRIPGRATRYLNQPDGPVTLQSPINGALHRAEPRAEKPASAPSEPGRESG
jgi:hypothetical protein